MNASELKYIRRCAQWVPKEQRKDMPRGVRGIYALHKKRSHTKLFDVVYIGMASEGGGVRSRLERHSKSKRKDWSHFSVFEVWPNIPHDEVAELEGLFREIYRKDKRANRFNRQGKCKRIQSVRVREPKLSEAFST